MIGSSWNEDNYDWDDGPMGISSSMKEDIRRESGKLPDAPWQSIYKDDGDPKLVKD